MRSKPPSTGSATRRLVLALVLPLAVAVAACTSTAARPDAPKELYLTFDDGPAGATGEILDVLRAHDATATFFAVGENLVERLGLARRVLAEGHVLAAHAWNHPNLTRLGPTELAAQLDRSVSAVRDAGSGSQCLRPPYGAIDDTVRRALRERGLRPVLWNVDSSDWREPDARVIADRLLRGAYPGAVVLLHDGGGNRSATIEALRVALPELRSEGYEFRAVPDC